jgi:hypothetical protein
VSDAIEVSIGARSEDFICLTVVDRTYAGRLGDSMRFRLDIDRTYLPPIIDALRAVENAWPILGKP